MIASAFSSGSLTLQYFTAAQHFVFHKWSLEEYRSLPRSRSHETNKLLTEQIRTHQSNFPQFPHCSETQGLLVGMGRKIGTKDNLQEGQDDSS